jgi:CBS domain-containing protein
MVSEGDLVGRDEAEREARRDWWLTLLAEGEELHPDFLATLRRDHRTAGNIMATPVVAVGENTSCREIARLLAIHHIKRVPVLRGGRLVGIVSRADLLRAFAAEPVPTPEHHRLGVGTLVEEALASLDRRFLHGEDESRDQRSRQRADQPERGVTAADFKALVADFAHHEAERRNVARHDAAMRRRVTVTSLIDRHVGDEAWRTMLHAARETAEHGAKEHLLLRFPSELCSDGGRAINAPRPEWPATLRGEAAEIYLRWEHELRPLGFHLSARVLDFPGGKPGDIGLFLVWGE